MAARFSGPGLPYEGLAKMTPSGPRWTGVVRVVEEHLEDPIRWTKPRRIFVNSMSDLFHESLPDEEIERVFGVMALAQRHTFQVLTKRPDRMLKWFNTLGGMESRELCVMRSAEYRTPGVVWDARGSDPSKYEGIVRGDAKWLAKRRPWPGWPLPNVLLGVSVEDQATADERIPLLLQTPAAVRFLSCEPLLGSVDVSRFTSYTPSHEHNQEGRGVDLRSSDARRAEDRHEGAHLAHGQARRRSLEGWCENKQVRESSSGKAPSVWISGDQGDGQRDTMEWTGAPTRLATHERADPGGKGDQPQERSEVRQSAVEPRSRDALREREARDEGTPGRAVRESERSSESCSQTDNRAGRRDQGAAQDGREACEHRERLRRSDTDDLPHRAWRSANLWIICGGESGPGARPCDLNWIRAIVDQCRSAGVPVFVKQMGSNVLGFDGCPDVPCQYEHSKGGDPAEWPEDLRVREFPEARHV